jgi:antitoxin component YwqK of YwqJK toxin-antitoxin module
MKRIIALFVLILASNATFAQECKKTCKKSDYVMVDGLIKAQLFHDNGVVAQTGYYTQENKLQGEWISYDADGNRTAIAYYDNGDKVGTWMFFQGDVRKEVSYENSRISNVKTWTVTDSRIVSY